MLTDWLKSLAVSLCILTILLQLVPDGKFARYVRFYGGLFFFLTAARPVLQVFSEEGELERLIRLEFLREDYYDMETAVAGMTELKNDQVKAAFQQELLRQIRELVQAYGLTARTVETGFGGEDGYELRGVEIELENTEAGEASEAVRKEIAEVYSVDIQKVKIRQGSGKE